MKSLFLSCLMFSFLLGCNCTTPPAPDTPATPDTPTTPDTPATPEISSSPIHVEGNHITVKVGQTFTIEIPGNITTGFVWRQVKDNANQTIVSTVGEDYRTPKSKIPTSGAPGTHYFTFRAEEAGECTLRFENLRPWEEEEDPPTESYQITVQ
ncbi:MAG: protease inhibitor I42 family protein [Victivallales bacterium]|nr:protease inhibitor I42 family protein [Victivallales bacterium]